MGESGRQLDQFITPAWTSDGYFVALSRRLWGSRARSGSTAGGADVYESAVDPIVAGGGACKGAQPVFYVQRIAFLLVLAFFVGGGRLIRRRRQLPSETRRFLWICAAFFAGLLVNTVLFWGDARFRLPVDDAGILCGVLIASVPVPKR